MAVAETLPEALRSPADPSEGGANHWIEKDVKSIMADIEAWKRKALSAMQEAIIKVEAFSSGNLSDQQELTSLRTDAYFIAGECEEKMREFQQIEAQALSELENPEGEDRVIPLHLDSKYDVAYQAISEAWGSFRYVLARILHHMGGSQSNLEHLNQAERTYLSVQDFVDQETYDTINYLIECLRQNMSALQRDLSQS